MPKSGFKSEKVFLIEKALTQFNRQYGKALRADQCTIQSVTPHYGQTHGYEIETLDTTDYVRIRMYLSIRERDDLRPFRIEMDNGNFDKGGHEDEVYVTLGTISPYYRDAGIYRFRHIAEDPESFDYLLDMEGNVLEWMDGTGIRTMGAS